MRKILTTILFAISPILPVHAADWEGVFEGTIGKAKVIVELNAGAEKSEYKGGYLEGARYSYLPKPFDINLILDEEGNVLRFTETLLQHGRFADEDDKKITGKWSLSVNGDAAIGTWTSPAGDKSLPISLTRVDLLPVSEVPKDANPLPTTYETRWLETVNFNDAGTAKTFGEVEVRFTKDSAFGIAFPVLGNFPDGNRKAKVNALLLTQHMKSVVEYRSCLNGVPQDWRQPETEPQFSYDVDYASPTLLSYTESGSVFCGGAHPSNYIKVRTFDLTAPAQIGGDYQLDLSPQGFGRILKLANLQERIAFERFVLGRWKEGAAKDKEMGADCGTGWIDDSPEGEKELTLSILENGLAVNRTDFPHALSVCLSTAFNPTIIPWADLKPWLKDGQTLLTTEVK